MGRGPFFYHAVAPINNGWLHYQPKQQCTIHGKSLKTTFFFHSLNLWFPKQMGSHWPPTFLEGKNSTTNKFPARPRGNFPPPKPQGQASFQGRPFCHQARRSSHWPGPSRNSGTQQKGTVEMPWFLGVGRWLKKLCHPYGTGMGIFT